MGASGVRAVVGFWMGASIGSVVWGAILLRVFLQCMRGIVRVRCGAVGFVDVACGAGSPFELGHGRVAGL